MASTGSPGTIDKKKNTSVISPKTVGIISSSRRTMNAIIAAPPRDNTARASRFRLLLTSNRDLGARWLHGYLGEGVIVARRVQLEAVDIGPHARDVVRVPHRQQRQFLPDDVLDLAVESRSLLLVGLDAALLQKRIDFLVRVEDAVRAVRRHGRRVEDVVQPVRVRDADPGERVELEVSGLDVGQERGQLVGLDRHLDADLAEVAPDDVRDAQTDLVG